MTEDFKGSFKHLNRGFGSTKNGIRYTLVNLKRNVPEESIAVACKRCLTFLNLNWWNQTNRKSIHIVHRVCLKAHPICPGKFDAADLCVVAWLELKLGRTKKQLFRLEEAFHWYLFPAQIKSWWKDKERKEDNADVWEENLYHLIFFIAASLALQLTLIHLLQPSTHNSTEIHCAV